MNFVYEVEFAHTTSNVHMPMVKILSCGHTLVQGTMRNRGSSGAVKTWSGVRALLVQGRMKEWMLGNKSSQPPSGS